MGLRVQPPLQPPIQEEGCLLVCMKALFHLVQKIGEVAIAFFRFIFCCPPPEDMPPPIPNLGDRVDVVEDGEGINADNQNFDGLDPDSLKDLFANANNDRERILFKNILAKKGVVVELPPRPVAPLPQDHEKIEAGNQNFELLDVDILKELLAASNDIREKLFLKNALRKKGVQHFADELMPEPPVRIVPIVQPRITRIGGVNRVIAVTQEIPIIGGIPLRPTAPPTADDSVQIICPAAPLRMAGSTGTMTKEQLIQFIKTEIGKEACWGFYLPTYAEINIPVTHSSQANLAQIEQNCDRLTNEDWIQILNEIPRTKQPSPIIGLNGSYSYILQEADIKQAFRGDREVVLKQRLAYLATLWVNAKQAGAPRGRDNSPEHPFSSLYADVNSPVSDCGAVNGENTVVAFQELIRFLPLIKAFAAQKKEIRVTHTNLKERSFAVNYLLDSVLRISMNVSNLIIHNMMGRSTFEQSNIKMNASVSFKELDSDKIANGADTLWNTYLKAKDKGQLDSFLTSFDGLCFDGRISSLNTFGQKLIGGSSHPDFMLKTQELKKGTVERAANYYNVFICEQLAVYCERQEPKLKYKEFKEKIQQERGTDTAKNDPVNQAFFKQYATEERFKAWALHIGKEKDASGNPILPPITQADPATGKDALWEETLATLSDVLLFDFEP